jgi:DNA invertase Pin-like site-specific DNA recombinase
MSRVSTKKQDYELQVKALRDAGCEKIFSEKQSGKSLDGRPEFKKLMKSLLPGDTVVVTRLDRLARSTRDMLNIMAELESLSAGFLSLSEAWCDTTSPTGKLLLTVLGGISEFERSLILSRTEAGIAKAREQGKQFGRPTKLDAGQRRIIAARYQKGETLAQLAAEYEVSEPTIWRVMRPFQSSAAA